MRINCPQKNRRKLYAQKPILQPIRDRLEQAIENYSSTVLSQMLTRQGTACMAQQYPHEQPELTFYRPLATVAAFVTKYT